MSLRDKQTSSLANAYPTRSTPPRPTDQHRNGSTVAQRTLHCHAVDATGQTRLRHSEGGPRLFVELLLTSYCILQRAEGTRALKFERARVQRLHTGGNTYPNPPAVRDAARTRKGEVGVWIMGLLHAEMHIGCATYTLPYGTTTQERQETSIDNRLDRLELRLAGKSVGHTVG